MSGLPEPHERIGQTPVSEPWYRFLLWVRDSLSGRLPTRIPVVHVTPTSSQRGLPNATQDGQTVIAIESGVARHAYSYGGSWYRTSDDTVIT